MFYHRKYFHKIAGMLFWLF